MARVIVLDAGPLGEISRPAGPESRPIDLWRIRATADGVLVVIPEMADYEVRRELLRTGATAGLARLDALRDELAYAPISTTAMRRAATLWADARRRGLATADDRALDADVIVAAQALDFVGAGDRMVIATDNARHLGRFPGIDARPWQAITP